MMSVSGSLDFSEEFLELESVNESSQKVSIGGRIFIVTWNNNTHGNIEFDGGAGGFEVDTTQTPPFHVIKGNLGELGQLQISVISVTTVRVVFLKGKDTVSVQLEKHVSWLQKMTIFGDPKAILSICLVVLLPILLGFLARKLDTMKINKDIPVRKEESKDEKTKEKAE